MREAHRLPAAAFGVACGAYKWAQTQSHVEVWVKLPLSITAKQVGGSCRCAVAQPSLNGVQIATASSGRQAGILLLCQLDVVPC
jgi:hypothetical protein